VGENLTTNWVEFFNLKGNPFSTSPLEDDFELNNLLVRTKSIRDQVLPVAKFIKTSAPSIKILLGARGSGKSTCLSYLRKQIHGNINVLSILITEIRFPERIVEDPTLAIGSPMLWFIIKDILESLRVKYEQLYKDNQETINRIGKNLSISELSPSNYPVWSTCNVALDELLKILKSNNLTLFLGIDNYDKLPKVFQKTAVNFLRGNNAQPFFEKLQRIGTTIIITLGREFYSQLSHPDFSYLGKPIEIQGLNPNESQELLSKRINWMMSNSETSDEDIFTDTAIHRLTMQTNGIPRELLMLAEQSMLNASKRNQKSITEKIVKDTIQISEEVSEEYYVMIKKIKPPSMAKAAETGLKVLSGYFSNIPSSEFAINVIDCLISIFEDPHIRFESNNEYLQSLEEAKIISLVEAFPKEEWTIRMDVLNLMGHMHGKKSLRKFLDWIKEKEIQVKPPDYQIIRMFKRGTELAYKYDTLLDTLDIKEVKECLTRASSRIRELDAYTLENELDSNTQILGMVEIIREIATAIYYFNRLLNNELISKTIPDKDRLLRFLKMKNANLWFDMKSILSLDELRYLEPRSKERVQEGTMKYVSFVENAYILLSQQNRDLLKSDKQPKELVLKNYFDLEPHFDQMLSDRKNHLVIEDIKAQERMSVVLWRSLRESREEIYGFATGSLTEKEREAVEKFLFQGQSLRLFSSIENDLINYRPIILRDFYQENQPMKFFNISDFTRFVNSFLQLPELSQGTFLSVLNEGKITDQIFLRKINNSFRLTVSPIQQSPSSKSITELKEKIPQSVVIDGNNVARDGKKKRRKARYQNIMNAILKLKERKIEVTTIVTRSLFHDIDDEMRLENLISTKLAELPPSGRQDDDYYFLSYALEKDAHVLTNDNLRDWKKANPEKAPKLSKIRIPYFFIKGELFFEGPLGQLKPPE